MLPTEAQGAIGTITPATLTASLSGEVLRDYDGTVEALLGPDSFRINGFVGSEGAGITATAGSFSGKDAGNGLVITALLSGADFNADSGTLLSNYVLPTEAQGAIGTITPATLSYVAEPTTRPFQQQNPALSGTVEGFVGTESLASATSGTLVFATSADFSSPEGAYAIQGGGLTAINYRFVQDASNETALKVLPPVSPTATIEYVTRINVTAAPPPPPPPPPVAPPPPPPPAAAPAPPPPVAEQPPAAEAPGEGPPPPPPAAEGAAAPDSAQAGGMSAAATPPNAIAPAPAPAGPPVAPPPSAPSIISVAAAPVAPLPASPVPDTPPPTPVDEQDSSDPILQSVDINPAGRDMPPAVRQLAQLTKLSPYISVSLDLPVRQSGTPGVEIRVSATFEGRSW